MSKPNFKLPKGTNCMPSETQIDRNASVHYKIEEALKKLIEYEFANRHWNGICCSGNTRAAIAVLRQYRENRLQNKARTSLSDALIDATDKKCTWGLS